MNAANEELADQAALLAAENERLRAFAASLTHDLNQPLVALNGFLDLLVESRADQLDPDGQAWLLAAHRAADSLRSAIGALHANAFATPRELTEVQLDDVFAEAETDLAVELADAGARLQIEPLPAVVADRDMLVRVVVNLLGNACRYRDATRPLMIRVRHRGHTDDHVVVEVADNGRGFSPHELESVFAAGQRGAASTGCPGTGTGLAIVRSVMTNLRGSVWAETGPVGGRICLALRAADSAVASDVTGQTAGQRRPGVRMQLAAVTTRS